MIVPDVNYEEKLHAICVGKTYHRHYVDIIILLYFCMFIIVCLTCKCHHGYLPIDYFVLSKII